MAFCLIFSSRELIWETQLFSFWVSHCSQYFRCKGAKISRCILQTYSLTAQAENFGIFVIFFQNICHICPNICHICQNICHICPNICYIWQNICCHITKIFVVILPKYFAVAHDPANFLSDSRGLKFWQICQERVAIPRIEIFFIILIEVNNTFLNSSTVQIP